MKRLVPLIFLTISFTMVQGIQAQPLTSGQPISNGNPSGVGCISPPFYNGYIMGFAQLTAKGKQDMFLQGTDWHGRGTYLYRFVKLGENGIPVFASPEKVTVPYVDDGDNRGAILQNQAGTIYGAWKFGTTLKLAIYSKEKKTFSTVNSIKVTGLPRGFADFRIIPLKTGKYLLLFSITEPGTFGSGLPFPSKLQYTPEGFWPFDIPKFGLYGAVIADLSVTQAKATQLTTLDQGSYAFQGMSLYEEGEKSYLLTGTRLGNILMYGLDQETGKLSEKKYAVDSEGVLLRNPNVNAFTNYFFYSPEQQGLVTVGEGGIYYYQNTRKFSKEGNLIFNNPEPLLQEKPQLYGGSLVVPSVADWDGDGKLDLISGNSMGFIYFFKNTGSNENPVFIDPVKLTANGSVIHVQPGYREDIQGPGEARWGYTCPNVFDWNNDGLLDILTGDSRGKFMVYLNKGTKTNAKLAAEHTLYLEGMDLFGTWRVRPGLSKIGDKTAYVIADREDEFHLYWQVDDYNLTDGGKLKLDDQTNIRGNKAGGGTVGRSKIEIVDWDEDGKKDLLVGTYGKQSIPDTVRGLPLNMKPKRNSTVLFLKNVGTDENPIYNFPRVLKFKGENLMLGGHACAPSAARIGPGGQLNLIVGIETGAYMFYDRRDLSWE